MEELASERSTSRASSRRGGRGRGFASDCVTSGALSKRGGRGGGFALERST